MGIFNKIFRRHNLENANVSLASALALFGVEQSISGVNVTRHSAMGNPAVWRGVNLVANSVAKLPCILYRRGANDSRERDTRHPAYKLMKRQPNPYYSAYTLKQIMTAHAIMLGNGYAYVWRDDLGRPYELTVLDPESTYPLRENGEIVYVTRIDNKNHKLPPYDVIHIKGLGYDGLTGYSLLDIMKDSLGLGTSLIHFGNYFFRNNAKPSVVIEVPPTVRSPEALQELRNSWASMQGGLTNSHRPAVVRAGTKITPLGYNNEEGQYISSREFDLKMTADMLGIPPHLLGCNITSSYASLESETQSFLSNSLDHWLIQWELELNRVLLTERQLEIDSHYFEFERKALIAIDARTELDLITGQLNNGLLSWEESRQILNRPTDKDEKQEWRQPTNVKIVGEEPPAPPQINPVVEEPKEEPTVPPEEEPQEEPKEDATRAALISLAKGNWERIIRRMSKAVESGKHDLQDHKQVICDTFSCEPKYADDLLSRLQQEIDAILPEQCPAVFERLDPMKLTEEIYASTI